MLVDYNRRGILKGLTSLALTSIAPTSNVAAAENKPGESKLRGVSISGGEFYNRTGGVAGRQYFYPDQRDIDYFLRRGFNLIRVPFKWERVQRTVFGELDSGIDFRQLLRSVELITSRGAVCILDLHNYGRRSEGGSSNIIGSDGLPAEALQDFWIRAGQSFQSDKVWFGLMNEPHGIDATQWAKICGDCIRALRANGSKNKILVPGTAWTGAHSWISSGNAKAFEDFSDPLNNFLFEVHQYLDSDSSGTSGKCKPDAGNSRLTPFEKWCKMKPGRRGFLGEFGAGSPLVPGQENCAEELSAMLSRIDSNGDVWAGWAAWGGGRWWKPDYIMRLQGLSNAADTEYMRILMEFARS